MGSLKTSAVLMTTLSLLLADCVAAWYGIVTFYEDIQFKGATFPWGITVSQRCYNLSCFNDRASSVKWDNLVEDSTSGGDAHIAFYTGADCTGTVRDWITKMDPHYPENFELDGINDAVSSFMIWESGEAVTDGFVTPCPWDVTTTSVETPSKL